MYCNIYQKKLVILLCISIVIGAFSKTIIIDKK